MPGDTNKGSIFAPNNVIDTSRYPPAGMRRPRGSDPSQNTSGAFGSYQIPNEKLPPVSSDLTEPPSRPISNR